MSPHERTAGTPTIVRRLALALAEHNAPDGEGTTVDRVLVDGNDAVVLGTIRNVLRRSGRADRADFALHLTGEDGRIRRYHIDQDRLAAARAWGAAAAEAG